MSGFTDYHAHFVYGVDDGAQTREEMYAMLDAAAADGVRHLFATSHSTPGMERFPALSCCIPLRRDMRQSSASC